MRMYIGFIILICSFKTFEISAEADFYALSNIEEAWSKAQNENKHLLIDFYASWCAPCKWMDETTFADPSVLEALRTGYVSVKVNIDDFDGYALKEQYNVKVLPTILIFDNERKIIERLEETISPSNMVTLLSKNKSYKREMIHSTNVAPDKVDYSYKKSNSDKSEYRNSYKLQLGVFNSYENTLKFYKRLKETVGPKPIIVLNDFVGGSVVYRVLLGNFANTTEAEIYKTKLSEDFGIESNLFY